MTNQPADNHNNSTVSAAEALSDAPIQGRAGNRTLIAAMALLGLAVLGIGGVALRAALSSPSAASAKTGTPAPAGAEALAAGLRAAAEYQRDGKFVEAGAILGKLAETAPDDQPVRIAYAQALMGQKKYADGYQQYQAALALQPAGSTKAIAQGKDPHSAQLHFEAGTCAVSAGMLDRALEHYSMAQTADPAEPKYPLYLAMVQIKQGGPDGDSAAVASLLRAAKLNPDLGEAWGTLAELALRAGQVGLAEQHIEKARKLQPGVTKWRLVEARILNRRGEAERAATLLLALDPAQRNQPAVLTVIGESYGLMRKPAEAAKLYAEAFSAASAEPNPELAYQAALWYERAENAKEAANYAKTAAMLGHADARDMAARLGR